MDDSTRLLRNVALGDETARSTLLQQHRERLVKMIKLRMDARLQARFDASDVVQEALVVADRRLDNYAAQTLVDRPALNATEKQNECHGRVPFYPWLRKIAWEQLMKFHERHMEAAKRSVKREVVSSSKLCDESVRLLVDRLAGGEDSPSESLIKMERRSQIKTILKAMNLQDRNVIELRYLEQLSYSDIAAVLEISEPAVRTRHFRAIQRLHQALQVKDGLNAKT